MQKAALLILALASSATALPAPAAGAGHQATGTVYVIPIHGVIEKALVYVIRRGLNAAQAERASAIVFDMDTPGGRLDAAETILKLLHGVTVPTYTFVNPNAISAGAILAMATDHIYMAPGGKIGDAMPIMISLFGQIEDMPEALQEKSESYVAAMIRAAAQQKGHDPQLAEAMVRRDIEYKVGDEVISPAGRLLTLTSQDAARRVGPEQRPLLSEGTVTSLEELLERIGMSGSRLVEFKVTTAEQIARVIESLSILLLAGGLLGLYIEFKTPGFGLPGILGLTLLAVWFWGHHIAGLAGMEELVLFAFGLVLLVIEIVVLPGFGVVGVSGITLMVVALLMAMVGRYPGEPWYPRLAELLIPARSLGLALLLSFLGLWAAGRWLPQTPLFRHLVLATTADRAAGFRASEDTRHLVGRHGVAVTPLRPAGVAMVADRRLEVVTRGEFVDAGTEIVIAEAHGNRIIVERRNVS